MKTIQRYFGQKSHERHILWWENEKTWWFVPRRVAKVISIVPRSMKRHQAQNFGFVICSIGHNEAAWHASTPLCHYQNCSPGVLIVTFFQRYHGTTDRENLSKKYLAPASGDVMNFNDPYWPDMWYLVSDFCLSCFYSSVQKVSENHAFPCNEFVGVWCLRRQLLNGNKDIVRITRDNLRRFYPKSALSISTCTFFQYNYGQSGGPPGYDVNVVPVWKSGFTGEGVVVCILDDGIDHTHPDLKDNYVSYLC